MLQHLKENGLRYAISVSDIKVFSGVGVYPVIVTGNKRDADGSGMNTADGFREHTTSGFREYAAGSLQQLEARCFVVRPEIKQYKTFADHDIKIASGAAGFQAATLKQYIKEISDMEDTIIQVPDAPDTAEPAGCPAGMDRCGFIPFAVSGSIDRYRLTAAMSGLWVRHTKTRSSAEAKKFPAASGICGAAKKYASRE